MVSLFLLLGCNLSYIADFFAALQEPASASTRTLLKLASSVRALLKPHGDTLRWFPSFANIHWWRAQSRNVWTFVKILALLFPSSLLFIALRIPTAHDVCVISVCKWARAQNARDFPQTKPDSEINARDPHFLFYKFNENNILNNWEKKLAEIYGYFFVKWNKCYR